MTFQYSYKDLAQRAERITWRVEDLIGGERKLDFSRPFMPEGLARVSSLAFLSASEKRVCNQIRGHAYLSIFGLVEEFILPFVLDHARGRLAGDEWRRRALLEFADEEAKHIQLFEAFKRAFVEGFGAAPDVIGPPQSIAAHVLSQDALSVALLTLHIEWMTQRHFSESVEDDATLDPAFKSLLLHHWMEEHQHARLDARMVEDIAAEMSAKEIDAAIDGYLGLGAFLDGGLAQQTEFDLAALEQGIGRSLGEEERAEFKAVQRQSNRWTYIGSGMTHPNFLDSLEALSPDLRRRVEAASKAFL